MNIFRRRSTDDIARVRSEIERLAGVVNAQEQRTAFVETALSAGAHSETKDVTATDTTAASDAAAELSARLDAVVAQLGSLDTRLTSVSRELANQLSELGNDIDALQRRPEADPLDEAAIEDLRDTQLRLANEQVRYQIAFRSDLAKLAEQVRKPL